MQDNGSHNGKSTLEHKEYLVVVILPLLTEYW